MGDLEIVEVSNVEHHLTMCEPDTAVARFAGLDDVVLEGIQDAHRKRQVVDAEQGPKVTIIVKLEPYPR